MKTKAKSFDLETSRGTRGSEEDYEENDYRVEDPKQPDKAFADLGYRFGKSDFPKDKLIPLENYLRQDFLHKY